MTTDADVYQRLARALGAHRGDAEAYRRLGAQFTARRHMLGPRYGNRRLFVRERLVPLGLKETAAYKLVYDLEQGRLQGRAGFSAGNMLALAQAYETTPDAVIAVLDGGDLEPQATSPPRPVPAPRRDVEWRGGGDAAALEPYVEQVRREVYEALVRYFPDDAPDDPSDPRAEAAMSALPGAVVFPGDDIFAQKDAETWDKPALKLSEKIKVIAIGHRLRDQADKRENRRTGLIAGYGSVTAAFPALFPVGGKA